MKEDRCVTDRARRGSSAGPPRERDLGDARAHGLDREHDASSEGVPVERDVGRDITAGHVQDVEGNRRHRLIVAVTSTWAGYDASTSPLPAPGDE